MSIANFTALYISLICFGILFSFASSFLVWKNENISKRKRRFFIIVYILIDICAIFEMHVFYFLYVGTFHYGLSIFFKTVEYILVPLIGLFIGLIFDRNKYRYIQYGIIGANTLVILLNVFFHFIFRFEDGQFYHSSFYFIYMIFYILSFMYCILCGIAFMKKFQFRNWYILLFLCFFLAAAIIVQNILNIWLDFFVLSVCSLLIYIFMTDIVERTDAITGLENRRSFNAALENLNRVAVVIVMDIDSFKICNDDFGHSYGDEVLQKYGNAIRNSFYKIAKCYRIGGDEFALIVTKKTDRIDQTLKNFEEKVYAMKKEDIHFPSISYGKANFLPGTDKSSDIYKLADKVMYEAKSNKKYL